MKNNHHSITFNHYQSLEKKKIGKDVFLTYHRTFYKEGKRIIRPDKSITD
jgi:hypothetical protein